MEHTQAQAYTPPPRTDWDIKGYHGAIVSAQANRQGIPAFDGIWDVYDISVPGSPRKVTGLVGAIGMRYALYYVANYGMGGHTYRLEPRSNVALRSWRIGL